MKAVGKFIWALGFIPYLVKLPYLVHAWRVSRLDTPDMVFLPLSLILLVWAYVRSCTNRPQALSWASLMVMVPALAAFGLGVHGSVNAVQVAAAAMFAWGAWWMAWGWRSAMVASPAFVSLAFTTTSVTYWICNLCGIEVGVTRILKFLIVVLSLLALWRITRRFLLVPALVAVLALVARSVMSSEVMGEGDPFTPEFQTKFDGGWIAREIVPDEGFNRFFGTSKARQFAYATPSNTITVLAVEIGDNVHEVHPATHCMRTAGWIVASEEVRDVQIGERKLSIAEAEVSYGGQDMLSWTWYSDANRSTGSFIHFRRYATNGGWHTYQLRTSVAGGIDNARAVLKGFLSRFDARH